MLDLQVTLIDANGDQSNRNESEIRLENWLDDHCLALVSEFILVWFVFFSGITELI